MPKYLNSVEEVTETVETYVEAVQVSFGNHPNEPKYVSFLEEQVTARNGVEADRQIFERPDGRLRQTYSDDVIGTEFPLIDSDGNVIGSSTYGDVYRAIYSLYFHLAAQKDAEQA